MAAGLSPVWAIIVRFLVASLGLSYRIIYMVTKQKMPISGYIKLVAQPCLLVFIPAFITVWTLHQVLHYHVVIMTILYMVVSAIFILIIGLTKNERLALVKVIVSKIKK